jgi:predicted kinase
MCGKAGAGKSTLAASLAAQHAATRIIEDIWMVRLYGDQLKTFDDYLRLSPRLRSVIGPLTVDLLSAGRNVVLDFPANTRTSRQWFRTLFEQAGADHTLHFLDTPDQACLHRIGKRNQERPEGSHHLTEETFFQVSAYFQAPMGDEGFKVQRYPPGSGCDHASARSKPIQGHRS